MKKIFATIVIIVALVLLSGGGFTLATVPLKGAYSVYNTSMPTEEYNLNAFQAYARILISKEQGISVKFDGEENVEKLVNTLHAKKIYEEQIDGLTISAYYSALIRRSVTIGENKVNLQIAVNSDGTVVAGTPLILGSY